MNRTLALLTALLLHSAQAQGPAYGPADFDRLLETAAVLVTGTPGKEPLPDPEAPMRHFIRTAKCLKAPSALAGPPPAQWTLATDSNTLFWVTSELQVPPGHVSLWMLTSATEQAAGPAWKIIMHYAVNASTLLAVEQMLTPPSAPGPSGGEWGVVKNTDSRCYSLEGTFLTRVPPGTLMEIRETRETPTGEMAIGDLHLDGKKVPDRIIKAHDMNIQQGSLAQADPAYRDLHIRQARLTGAIQEEEARLYLEARAKNPHTAEFERVRAEFEAFWAQVRELEAARNTATGKDRMKQVDTLRKMKGQDITLGLQYEKTVKQYNAWNRQNLEKTITSPELTRLTRELARVHAELAALTGGQEGT